MGVNAAVPRQGPAQRLRFGVVAGLGMAAVWLCLAAVVGAIAVAGDDDVVSDAAAAGSFGTIPIDPATGQPVTTVAIDPVTGQPLPPGAQPTQPVDPVTGQAIDPTTGQPLPPGTDPGQPGQPAPTAPPVTVPGDRTGVTDSEIRYGVHAPLTIGGAPVALAEDPVTGVRTYLQYINERGGVNGRTVTLDLQDDQYTVSGASTAATRLIEHGNFFISGTLGVDQIYKVASEARARGIPYMAAGGPEDIFGDIGMFQLGTSYDTHVIQLARFLATQDDLRGKKIGVVVLNSPYLLPIADVFEAEAARLGLNVVATETVEKPTDQTTYTNLIQAFNNAGVELYVPLHDPITTTRIVTGECQVAARCPWTYTFSNFAHDSDVALSLFGGKWGDLHVRGLAGGCYYLSPTAYDPARCAAMGTAHDQWVAIRGEDSWRADGQGGASGYQLVHFWLRAMTDAGRDLTRERFVAALQAYSGYSDLISSPISFAGSSNYAHGSDLMVVFEAGTDEHYRQLTDGFVGF